MKRLLTILILLSGLVGAAQTVDKVEYFLDNDPGLGNGVDVPVTPAALLDINFNVDLSAANPGFHMLYIRALQSNGHWSETFNRPILNAAGIIPPNVTKAEYFLDNDPGFGNGTNIVLPTGSSLDTNFVVDLSAAPSGFHMLYVRAQDQLGGWSQTFARPILNSAGVNPPNITNVEYYIDNDPGFGNGTAVTITPAQTLDLTSMNIDLSAQPKGFHMLYIRARDAAGGWSQSFNRPFLNAGGTAPVDVTAGEYFLDNDPGFGNGTAIGFTPTNSIDSTITVDLNGVNSGFHMLYIRYKDEYGSWGQTFNRPILVNGPQPNVTTYEYSIDSAVAIGSGTAVALMPGAAIDTNLVLAIAGLTQGQHKIFMRSKDSNNAWGLTQQDVFCVGPTASFTADTVCAGSATTFTDASVDTIATTTYSWDVDADGTIDYTTKGDITHQYATAGVYTALLIMDKDSACSDTMSVQIEVLPNSMVASFTSDTVCYGNPTTLTSTSTGTSTSTTYEWDIDNDGSADYTGASATHTFSTGGSFVTKLVAYEDISCISQVTVTVEVDSTAVNAAFSADTACFGNNTVFTDLSTGGTSTTTYDWDFTSDGASDDNTVGNTSFSYGVVGDFSATLILNSAERCPDTAQVNVNVDSLGVIHGQVFNDNGPITSGYVKVFSHEITGAMDLVDSIAIDGSGNYVADNLPYGDYILRVHPDTLLYPDYVTTYYDSTFQWENASVISNECDTTIDIGLLNLNMVQGPGVVSGFIFTVDTVVQNKSLAGDPVPGIDISLEQIPGGIIGGQTTTDSTGFYEFNDLPQGDFVIYVDIPGKGMDSSYTVGITALDTLYEDMNFMVDSAKIYIEEATGINTYEIVESTFDLRLYPNPYQSATKLELMLHEANDLNIEVYDMMGRQVFNRHIMNQPKGLFTMNYSSQALGFSAGTYIMKVQIGVETKFLRLIESQ